MSKNGEGEKGPGRINALNVVRPDRFELPTFWFVATGYRTLRERRAFAPKNAKNDRWSPATTQTKPHPIPLRQVWLGVVVDGAGEPGFYGWYGIGYRNEIEKGK